MTRGAGVTRRPTQSEGVPVRGNLANRRVRRTWRDVPWMLIWRLSDACQLHDVEVRAFASNTESQAARNQLARALELIESSDPMRMRRLRRDLRGILLTSTGAGSFLPALRICQLGMGYALRVQPEELAMTVVHEATHARLFQLGCGYRSVDREVIERICVEAEIRFARKLPGSEALAAKAEALLQRRWWTEEAALTSAHTSLRQLEVPEWLLRVLRWFG